MIYPRKKSNATLFTILLCMVFLISSIPWAYAADLPTVVKPATEVHPYSEEVVSGEAYHSALAVTTVKGFIDQDTTWTKAKSPYTMTAAVNVAEGVTLTIEPGVTVNFADPNYPCSLKVYGNLIIQGTETDKVTFKTNTGVTSSVILPNNSSLNLSNWVTDVPITLTGNDNSLSKVSSTAGLTVTGDRNILSGDSFTNAYIAGNDNSLTGAVVSNQTTDIVKGNNNKISKTSYTSKLTNETSFNILGNNNSITQCNFNKL